MYICIYVYMYICVYIYNTHIHTYTYNTPSCDPEVLRRKLGAPRSSRNKDAIPILAMFYPPLK